MPASSFVLSFINRVTIMPTIIAVTAPPMIGNRFPKNQEGTAMARHSKSPGTFFLIQLIFLTFLPALTDYVRAGPAYHNTFVLTVQSVKS